jgi:alpha-ketoglutarate-dependent taurine dioxygenase
VGGPPGGLGGLGRPSTQNAAVPVGSIGTMPVVDDAVAPHGLPRGWCPDALRSVHRRLACTLAHVLPPVRGGMAAAGSAAAAAAPYPAPVDAQAPWLFPRGTLERSRAQVCAAEQAGLLAVRPLGAHIGAEVVVHGAEGPLGSGHLSEALVSGLRAALNVHKVLVMRGQRLNHEQHVKFTRQFGELTLGHIALRTPQNAVPGHPEIFALVREGTTLAAAQERVWWWARQYETGAEVSTGASQMASAASGGAGASPSAGLPPISNKEPWWLKRWHTDITGAVNPPAFSVLRPERGGVPPPSDNPAICGDTRWCNLAQAYRELPSSVQRQIEGLRALHDLYELAAEHPLVAVQPVRARARVGCVAAPWLHHGCTMAARVLCGCSHGAAGAAGARARACCLCGCWRQPAVGCDWSDAPTLRGPCRAGDGRASAVHLAAHDGADRGPAAGAERVPDADAETARDTATPADDASVGRG